MFSTVPGFASPKAARFSANDVYVSAKATERALLVKKPKGESFSSAIAEDILCERLLDRRSDSVQAVD